MIKISAIVLAAFLTSSVWAQPAVEEASKSLVTRFWRDVWNPPYRMETIDELLVADFTITTDGKDIKGRDIHTIAGF